MKYHYLAAVDNGYSCAAYGASTYGDECQTQQGVLSPDTGWQLTNVGYEIIVPAALGVAVLIAGLIALAKKMKRQKQ